MQYDEAALAWAQAIVQLLVPVSFGSGVPSEPDPSTSVVGDLFCDTGTGQYYEWTGVEWDELTGGGGGGGSPDYDVTGDDEGQASSAYGYREIVGGVTPSSVTWYTNSGKGTKVYEVLITRDGSDLPVTIVRKWYNGGVLARTITDTITNSAGLEVSRVRAVT